MNVADVMTRSVITVTPSMAVGTAASLMLEHRVSGLPVVDGEGAVVGLITEGDLLRRAETGTERRLSWWRSLVLGSQELADQYVHSHGLKVQEVMTRGVVSVAPSSSLAEAVLLMEARSVKRLVVLEGKRLAGILSRADLLRALETLLRKEDMSSSVASSDAAIRRRILSELERQRWAPKALIDVKVNDGVVTLCGLIFNQTQRDALRVLVENTPDVTEVVDDLVWIEPYTGTVVRAPDGEQASAATPAPAS